MCDRRRKTTAKLKKKVVRPMPICSFCLGDEKCNRNHQPEQFISCVDCGNSGHPSCLKFSIALTKRVKRTQWQCIDCKRCAKCSGIGRDENMLFCDSCDRGVHMKCCYPPLTELPSGEWFCFLCESNTSDFLPSDNVSITNGQRMASPAATKQNKPERKSLAAPKSEDTKCKTRSGVVLPSTQSVRSCSRKPLKLNKSSSQGKPHPPPSGTMRNLNDGLTQFFTPSNKRKSRVSSVSLEGIVAATPARDRPTRVYRRRGAVGVTLKPSHHRVAKQLIKKSQCIQRKQIQKETEEQKMNYQLRALTVLHDGLSQYFTARGQRKSLFRRTDGSTDGSDRTSRVEGSSPAAVKRRRRSQRGDHVEVLFDGLTHFFTAHGKRPSAFRKPSVEEFVEPTTPAAKESLFERRKRQHKHRTQVQLLFDGMSKFFTARNARRSEESVHSPVGPSPTRKMSSSGSKDDIKGSADESKFCRKRKLEDDILQTSLKLSPKRLRSSAPAMSSSQRVASQIVEKSRLFKAKKENKKVVRRRRRESCQLKSLFDGLSHLYTAQGERQRKSFNFYCLSVRHHTHTGGSSNGTDKLDGAKESAKMEKSSSQETSVKSSSISSQKSGSAVKTGLVTDREEENVKTSKVVSKNRTVNKPMKSNSTAESFSASGKKMKQRSLSRSDVKCFSDVVTKEDLELFRKAKADSSKRFISQEGSSALELGPDQTGPGSIEIGKYKITAWHSSPYPLEFASLSKLYICEFCLKCFKSRVVIKGHMTKCVLYHPPGDEIYRSGSLSLYEVDGKVNKQYCQNLCLLAKLFLDHKTLYYDVEPFLFYVLTHTDDGGSHLIGYFSKEKYCQQKYNLSCIMTLPPYQRKGYGRFLIDFSYLLSRREGQPGSPEKPLSELGRVSYCAFWKSVVIEYLHAQRDLSNISIQSISEVTGLMPGDIATTLQSLDMMQIKDSKCSIVVRRSVLDEYMAKAKVRQDVCIPLTEDALHWSPFVTILGIERDDKALLEKAGKKRLRSRGLEGRHNDDFVAEKKCRLKSVPKGRMVAECFEKRPYGRRFHPKVIVEEESCDCNDNDSTLRVEGPQFIDALPQENGKASEKHGQQRSGRSFHGGKKPDRSRVSCNNRSPQIDKDYPNKPRKRTKSSHSTAVCSLATKGRQGGSVECQSESRDSSEKSSEVSDGVASTCGLSLMNRQSGGESMDQQQEKRPCLPNRSEDRLMTSSVELLPGSGTRSAADEDDEEEEDSEEVNEDCVAKVKNLRSITGVDRGDEILPDALNACVKAVPDPGSESRGSLLTAEVHITNQDEGFSSCAEDGLESSATGDEDKRTREDRISHRKRKRTSLPIGLCDVTVENMLPGINLSRDELISGSTSDAASSMEGSEVTLSVEKDAMDGVRTSSPHQVTSASEKFNSLVDTNRLPDLDSKMLRTESGKKRVAPRGILFFSTTVSYRARKSPRPSLEPFQENNADDVKRVDLAVQPTVEAADRSHGCTEVAKEEDENTKASKSPTVTSKRRERADTDTSADRAQHFGEVSVLRTCLGEDRTDVGSTPSCSDFDCAAESEDEKKMDRSFDSPADFKDSSEFKSERCEAPDYAELFGFQMGDLQDRMDRQTGFGEATNRSAGDSPTESVDGAISSGDDQAPGNALPTASDMLPSASATDAMVPLQSSSDQTDSSSVYPLADALPLTGSVVPSSCAMRAVSSPLSDSYILTPSPTNSMPPSVGLVSPISPPGGGTGRPQVASMLCCQASIHVPDESSCWSDEYKRSKARPLPYPDAGAICKLQQLTSHLDEASGNNDDDVEDVTVIGMRSEQQQQQAMFQQPSSPASCAVLPSLLSLPVVRETSTPLSSLSPCPLNRMHHLVPDPSGHPDSAFIPLQRSSSFQPPNQPSRFTNSHHHPSLLLHGSAPVQSFSAMSPGDGMYPRDEDVSCSATMTPVSFRRRSYHSAFHSHIPDLNYLQPPQFAPNSRYVANPATRRYCQSSILTPPPSVERNQMQSRSSQSLAYPLSYWIGPQDQNLIGMRRNEDFGFRTSKRSLSSECSPVGGLESSVNSEDGFYNIPYLNSVGTHSLSSAH